MFLAHVLVGRSAPGQQGYRKPPPIDQNEPFGKAYDSCINDPNNPTIYVVFESSQIYPEYMVEYELISGL